MKTHASQATPAAARGAFTVHVPSSEQVEWFDGLLAAAMKAVGTDSRAKIRDGLIGLKGYEGATGPISYDKGRDPAKTLVRIMIKDGNWVLWK